MPYSTRVAAANHLDSQRGEKIGCDFHAVKVLVHLLVERTGKRLLLEDVQTISQKSFTADGFPSWLGFVPSANEDDRLRV